MIWFMMLFAFTSCDRYTTYELKNDIDREVSIKIYPNNNSLEEFGVVLKEDEYNVYGLENDSSIVLFNSVNALSSNDILFDSISVVLDAKYYTLDKRELLKFYLENNNKTINDFIIYTAEY